MLVAYFESLADSPFRTHMLAWFRSRGSVVVQKESSRLLGRDIAQDVAQQALQSGAHVSGVVPIDVGMAPPPGPTGASTPSNPAAAFLGIQVKGAGDPKGWDFDVFGCETSLRQSGPALVETGDRVVGSLSRMPGVGRVRPRVLPAASDLRPGYYMIIDDVAAEQDEARQVQELLRGIEEFELRPNETAPSPWYISVFLCPS